MAGVAGGWAARWRVEPTVVRAALGVLTLVGGFGVVVYAIGALLSSGPVPGADVPAPRADRRRELAIGCATGAVLVLARAMSVWPGDAIMVPAAAVSGGIAISWTRARPLQQSTGGLWAARGLQVLAGVGLLAAGVLSLANRTGGLANVGASASAIAVVVGGMAMFAAPAVGRLLRTLDDERALRIREDERAKVAAHLHDSVLQSLVLIQRNDDPRRMASLARRQERELRSWLYGSPNTGDPSTLHAAIEAMTAEVESDHDLRIEVVIVGDQPVDDTARALLAALREAIVNAARHADVDRVDVFVEADSTELNAYVRDTGRGFDPGHIAPDRRGITDSILGRVRRSGGTATISSEPGVGTEVEIRLPRGRS